MLNQCPHPSFNISHCFPILPILLFIRALNSPVSDSGVGDWLLVGEDWDWIRVGWDWTREDWDWDWIREDESKKVGGGVTADTGSRFKIARSPPPRMSSRRKS